MAAICYLCSLIGVMHDDYDPAVCGSGTESRYVCLATTAARSPATRSPATRRAEMAAHWRARGLLAT